MEFETARTAASQMAARSSSLTAWPRSEADANPNQPDRDWKRTVLIVGLGILSWVATYVGMMELIEANMGDLPIIHRAIIGFSVAMLMIMIIWLLDQLFKPHSLTTKLIYASGYVFLTLISVGFGFGFYWKVLESRGESSRSAESAVAQVQNSLQAASTRLEQLQATLVQLTSVSNEKAELERTKGTSCPNSTPGDGPRRKMRDEDAQRFTFASEFVRGRVTSVKGDLTALDSDLLKITSADASTFDTKTGTRNEFMRSLGRKLDLTVTGFNAFRTDPQLRQIRSDLADRAERTTVTDLRGGAISCPDAQLQTALRGVVKAIDLLPEMTKPEIAAVEGSEATIEAFRRLTTTFYGMLAFKMPPSADDLRDLQKKAVQSVESNTGNGAQATASARAIAMEHAGLSKRDYVPLAVALFVDLCLLLVSMVQRPNGRLDGLVPKMQAAERGPVIQILARFNDIHRDQQVRENFEIFRHVVFDMHGDYYIAVPLDAPPRLEPMEREALRVEAQLLSNLFASFEKEKIFKRTMLPTTGSIRKRLARQGSKFAASEAFRVYKFSDGAWSDIILGAVMGAARRIEDTERMRPTMIATISPPNDLSAQPTMTNAPSRAAWPPTEPVRPRTRVAAVQQPAQSAIDTFEPTLVDDERPSRSAAHSAQNGAQDPVHVSRFGPYSHVYRPTPPAFADQPPFSNFDVRAKNGSDDLAFPSQFQRQTGDESGHPNARVVELIQPTDAASRGDHRNAHVTLSRETTVLSVPVSEAVMPDALRAALRDFSTEVSPLRHSPEDNQKNRLTSDRHNKTLMSSETAANDDELTIIDLALIGRMAPPAAE